MARYRTSVRSPWHPADAYDVMKDLSRFDEWDPGITAAVLVSGEAHLQLRRQILSLPRGQTHRCCELAMWELSDSESALKGKRA